MRFLEILGFEYGEMKNVCVVSGDFGEYELVFAPHVHGPCQVIK